MNGKSIELWPGWETVRVIGRGSFGTVYEIERDVFGQKEKAALKVVSIPQSSSDIEELRSNGYDDASITETFNSYLKNIVDEYSLMRKLNGSANVVNCDDVRYVQHDDGYGWDIYIKMELVTPLTRALGKTVPEEQVIQIGTDICKALILCKKHNIIHRDIKPANIFISENGDYKLGDFGIAKTVEKTSGGTKIGTYEYMAPEVYHDEPYGSSADIYSLGLVMYWLLNDRRTPFLPLPPQLPTNSDKDLSRRKRFGGEPIPAPAHGSKVLKQIVLKACAHRAEARFQSANDFLEALNGIDNMQIKPHTANISSSSSVDDPSDNGTETIGVFRTEKSHDNNRTATPKTPLSTKKKLSLVGLLSLAGVLIAAILFVVLTSDKLTNSSPNVSGAQTTQTFSNSPSIERTENGLTYEIYDSYAVVTGCDKTKTYVEIPATVDGRPVTAVEAKAFYTCQALTSIILPESITKIGNDAFFACHLNSILIPSGVTSIGSGAFCNCDLISVNIPNKIKTINEYTFSGCQSMENVFIPYGVTEIGKYAFYWCISLQNVEIPDTVTSIGDGAFSQCHSLTNIVIPESVTKFGQDIFAENVNLTICAKAGSSAALFFANDPRLKLI